MGVFVNSDHTELIHNHISCSVTPVFPPSLPSELHVILCCISQGEGGDSGFRMCVSLKETASRPCIRTVSSEIPVLLLAMFLGSSLSWWEFMCSRHQIPPWEPHCLGPPCQVAQAFTTRRQAGGIQGDRALVSPEAAVILCCLGLAGGHGNTSRTPSHTQLAHPALPGNC